MIVFRLYSGTLRILLVLLHDFPEFLCDHHYSFCDVIPPNCIQMRNLILSAFPTNMRLPDPFKVSRTNADWLWHLALHVCGIDQACQLDIFIRGKKQKKIKRS